MKALKTSRNALRPALLLAALAAAFVASAASCSQQQEGEPCEIANGNEDCASGLECRGIGQQQLQHRCCRPGVVTQVCDPTQNPVTSTATTTTTTSGTGGAGTGGSGGDGAAAGDGGGGNGGAGTGGSGG
ncbi:hypothetical protein BE20_50900, partial [Sorangium cellulosum]